MSLLVPRVSCLSLWVGQSFPAPLKREQALSRRPSMALLQVRVSLYILFVTIYIGGQAQSHKQNVKGELGEDLVRNRIERSPLGFGSMAIAKIFEGARFLYSNGLDMIFTKPGGLDKALKDFDSANVLQRVRKLPSNAHIGISKVGKADNGNQLVLREDITGSAVLEVAKFPPTGMAMIDPAIRKIIVYSD